MIITLSMIVNAKTDDLWRVKAEQYANIGNLISGVYASEAIPAPGVKNAPVSGRICHTTLGKHPLIERISVYDPKTKRISYDAESKSFPRFVKHLSNHWELQPINETQTNVKMRLEGELSFPFNILMGPLMKMRFKSMMPSMINELAHFARSGEKHPDKVKFDASKDARRRIHTITTQS